MEKILRIEDTSFKTKESNYQNYEGYQVVTDEQTIKVGISCGQSCCENYGYMTTNDDLKEFEGADLISIEIVDNGLNKKKIEELYFNEGEAMFVNFNTSKGLMQLVAYNSHNGYYGHDAVLISKQLTEKTTL